LRNLKSTWPTPIYIPSGFYRKLRHSSADELDNKKSHIFSLFSVAEMRNFWVNVNNSDYTKNIKLNFAMLFGSFWRNKKNNIFTFKWLCHKANPIACT
jgi:hypothetical protein